MKKTSETILFFGSGPVAADSLNFLNEAFAIEAVITKPRYEHHKGPVPVLEIAEKTGLKTETVTDRVTLEKLFSTKPFTSKLAVLIDFGIIIPQSVIDYFSLGIINSHFSLLPQWRGADPITFAILSGQSQTGVSLMLLTAGMDEGPLIGQSTIAIAHSDTAPSLTAKLVKLSNDMLVDAIPKYMNQELSPYPQDPELSASYSRKLTKEDSVIDWQKSADQVEREIRAFSGWPKSRTVLGDQEVIITQTHVIDATGTPGTIDVSDKTLLVYCKDKALAIDRLKPANKKDMTSLEFLAGYKQHLGLPT